MMMLEDAYWLPIVFIVLTGVSLLVYAILDGYDLGIGLLLPLDSQEHRDKMIASIGPFWDANETWLVLAIGLLLIAFPAAHNIILGELYIPVALMLVGLILRGVAFDFRTKSIPDHKARWDWSFRIGSLMATWSQGYMMGSYIMGFEDSAAAYAFSVLSAVCVSSAYCFIGASWLVMKTEGDLQHRAARWARISLWLTAIGILAVSIVNPLVSDRIAEKWLAFPQIILLVPIPILCGAVLFAVDRYLSHFPHEKDFGCWMPFAGAATVFFLCFQGLAYSFYPYVVQDQLTIWEAASAPESLLVIFYGAVVVLPVIFAYTIFSYRVFWGKATELSYH